MAKYIKTENGYQETVDSIDTLQNKILDIDKTASDALEKASVQANWYQNDSTAVDYIKNNPFRKDIHTINFDKSYATQENLLTNTEVFGITDDKFYRVSHMYDDITYFLGGLTERAYGEGKSRIREIVGSKIRVFRSKNDSYAYAIYDYEDGKIIAICVGNGFVLDYPGVYRGLYMLYNSDSDYTKSIQRVLNNDLNRFLYGFDNIYNKYGTQYAIEDALKTKVDRQAIENLSTTEYVDEADERVLTEAKAYTDSQRVGYTEPGKVFTFDGDTTGKYVVGNMVKLSDAPLDLTKVKSVTVTGIESTPITYDASALTVVDIEAGSYLALDDLPTVLYCPEDTFNDEGEEIPKGTYTFFDVGIYVSRVEFEETIHPIDPKYLPESGVGYVEKTQTAILPETVVTPENHSTAFGVNGCFMLPELSVENGKEYKAVVDGETFDFTPDPVDGKPFFYAGNGSLIGAFGYPDTGHPWLVVLYPSMGVYAVSFADPAENEKSHTVAVYEVSETIHTIDPKYLPAGVGDNSVILDLNQLRLSFNTLFSGTEIPLGAEQIALADYAFKNKSDIVIVKDDSVGELYTDITKFRMTLNRVAYQDADGTNENVMEYSGMFFTSTGGGIVTLGLAYKTNLSSGVILGRALDITASTEV